MRSNPWALRNQGIALLLSILVPLVAACGTQGPGTVGTAQTAVPNPAPAATTVQAPQATATSTQAATVAATSTSIAASPEATATAAATATTQAAATTTAAATAASEATPPSTAATAATSTAVAGEATRPGFGVVVHLYYTDRQRVLQLVENAGFEWVRQQVQWKDTEKADRTFGFDELDQIVESVNARGQKLLLSIAKAPDFLTGRPGDTGLPKDPKDFGRFAEALATRYKGKLHAIEVWNEQNLAAENGGHVVPEDAARYVEILKDAYPRIKAVDPSIIVVAGALSSTGVTQPDIAVDDTLYLKNMYEYNGGEIRNYFDTQGFHPASAANHPDWKFPENPGNGPGWNDHPTHYFRHIEDVRQVMVEAGLADKKIWITEMGWATENNTPGYEYGNFISLEQQADYLEASLFRTVFTYGDFVGAFFIWNLNFAVLAGEQGNPLDQAASFGILNPDWSPRPAYHSIQSFISAAKSGERR